MRGEAPNIKYAKRHPNGSTAHGYKVAAVDVYTAATDAWTTATLSQPRSFPAAASLITADGRH
jgi:hypothetical protein